MTGRSIALAVAITLFATAFIVCAVWTAMDIATHASAAAPLLTVAAWDSKVRPSNRWYRPVAYELGSICEPCWLERGLVQPAGLRVNVGHGPVTMCPHGGGPQ